MENVLFLPHFQKRVEAKVVFSCNYVDANDVDGGYPEAEVKIFFLVKMLASCPSCLGHDSLHK